MKSIVTLTAALACLCLAAQAQSPAFDEAKPLWDNHGDKASLEKAIAVYEKGYQAGASYELAVRLAFAHYFLADAFLVGDAKAAEYYQGFEWGLNALRFNPEFKKLHDEQGKSMGDAVKGLGKEYAGGIFWAGTCVGKWAKMQGILKTLKWSKQARRMIEYLYTIDKDYYYAGPARWLGTYFAVAPGMFGGDMKKSKQMYDEAIAAHPDYFASKVLMAESYYGKLKDRVNYDKLLDEVLAGQADAIPEVAIEQRVEQAKATKLKAQKID